MEKNIRIRLCCKKALIDRFGHKKQGGISAVLTKKTAGRRKIPSGFFMPGLLFNPGRQLFTPLLQTVLQFQQ